VVLFLVLGCSAPQEAAQTGERSRIDPASLREQAILDAINRLRTDPDGFADFVEARTPFYQGKILRLPGHNPLETHEGAAALTQAVDELDALEPAQPLKLSPALRQSAMAHGRDIGPRGVVSHDGRDGSSPRDRMSRFAAVSGTTGEAISFGLTEPEDIVIELVVDDGVPSRAHRKLLLNPAFRFAGIACVPHAYYKTACIIDLAQSVGSKTPR
jgi:uncharacterized protein YkwD